MRSVPQDLDGQTFDFLIVGGGIQGAALAREAAVRGCSVLLVDRADFASGTSSRSSRLVHGGVRYLEQGHLGLVREALGERERLLRTAPHLVRPLPMLMPFFEGAGKPPWMMRTGLRIYSWLARGSTLPPPKYYAAADCARLFPGIRTRGLRGGSLFYDARTEDLRLTLAVLEAAAAAGARLANHVEVVGAGAEGVRLLDHVASRELRVTARRIVNAAGPHVDALRGRLGIAGAPLVRASRGSHVVLAERDTETALGGFLPDGRIQFVIPHPGGTLCGTTDVDEAAVDASPTVPRADVDYLLDALGFLLDPAPQRADLRFAYCGWRSLPTGKGPPGGLNREAFLVDEQSPAGPVHTVVGGKLTTHRAFAERSINRLTGRRDASPTRHAPLPGGAGPHDENDPLWWRHGSRSVQVRALIREEPSWGLPICPHRPFLGAEAVFAMREHGVVTFTDLMLRRLFHVLGPCLEDACLRTAHELYAREDRLSVATEPAAAVESLRTEIARLTGSETADAVRP